MTDLWKFTIVKNMIYQTEHNIQPSTEDFASKFQTLNFLATQTHYLKLKEKIFYQKSYWKCVQVIG